ncbi:MAG: hypothetical protein K2Q21_06390 [Chitinophagaceae bacterium]|nr:hypothetical protein [Chitinophagaceae bacterium]
MTDNQFDNFFREKLRDHTAPVPDGLWEKIHPEKDKRPKGFYLPKINGTGLMVAALLVGSVVIGLLTYQSKQSVAPVTENAIHQAPASNTINNQSNSKENKPSNNSTLLNPSSSNSSSQDEASETTTLSEKATRESIGDSKKVNNNLLLSSNRQALDISSLPFSTQVVANNKRLQAADQISSETETETEMAQFPPIANIAQGELLFFNLNNIASKTGSVQKQLAANGHDKNIRSKIIICPSSNRGRSDFNSDWAFELFASPDYSIKKVTNISASQQYLNKKDSSEQMEVGYSAGFRIVKPLTTNLLLKAGFQYSQVNQKFTYRNENEIKTTTVITNRTIIRAPGDTIIVADTSILRQVGFSVKTVHNHYKSIDIPVTIGYQFGNEDLSIGINGGVVFNLSSWYQGELLDTSLASVPINKISSSIYKTNIGMGLYSSISILKRINDNTHLFFEPYFRYNLSDMTNSQSTYNQRFHVGGLAIGLRFNLNR